MDLPYEKQFHFPDGTSAKNLNELKEKIETISYGGFYHHVGEGKNDFANWVRHVLKDSQLASQLERVDSIVETVEVLHDYLHPSMAQKHLQDQDDLQSHIERDILEIKSFVNEPEAPLEMPTEPTPELPEMHEQITQESALSKPEEIEEIHTHPRQESEEKKELHDFHEDIGKIIIKDFIWGFLAGVFIGFVLARMLML